MPTNMIYQLKTRSYWFKTNETIERFAMKKLNETESVDN